MRFSVNCVVILDVFIISVGLYSFLSLHHHINGFSFLENILDITLTRLISVKLISFEVDRQLSLSFCVVND